MLTKNSFAFWVLALGWYLRLAEPKVAQEEVDALQQISSKMGAKYWKFNGDTCNLETVGVTLEAPRDSESSIVCDCDIGNDTLCHVVRMVLKGYSLPGMLPPELVKLSYLREIDFAYNFMNGTIPSEWTTLQLTSISLTVNRLSGEIPKELGKMTNLTYLNLEANRFSGILPPELGNLLNLQSLILSSNELSGQLPTSFAGLANLTDFRINDNNFNGTIPDLIQNWKLLNRLEMHASGLEGPIPSSITSLNKLTELRISDINGPTQDFPPVNNMTGIVRLVLRSCNISGKIPAYIWSMDTLQLLDLSFNKLIGEIPLNIKTETLKFVFLTGNSLNGNVPDSILIKGSNVDLSYNNFTIQDSEDSACQDNLNLNINLFRNPLVANNLRTRFPCLKSYFNCPRYTHCSHVNCGGNDAIIEEDNQNIKYEGDGGVEGGTATYYRNSESNWGFSSTGDFLDDNDYQNTRYIATLSSSNLSELYTTARISPLSLTYFHYCLENGLYDVKLYFAEIQFTNDNTYSSLGKRIFDVYVQDELKFKNFNIEDKAHGAREPVIIRFNNISVTYNILEIRFAWAGKGTTRVPNRGIYGPLVSAISVKSDAGVCSTGGKKTAVTAYVVVGVVVFCLILLTLGILWWKGCLLRKRKNRKGFTGVDMQTGIFTLRQIKAATCNFDLANKIGEGGFGPVYKGTLPDGTIIAVKQLSSKSNQGNREFLNEIGTISCLEHPNLVKLHGCCIEGDQLLLVYEYMENNCLAKALSGPENSKLKLGWPTRFAICKGIARGLAFLHEESTLKIVHRDIKATNVLLDRDLNPKISDFGLARLHNEQEKSHISTRVAGTIGYMAPEYALWGHLTYKADVYSFGVVALEIVSGKNNGNFMPTNHCVCLLDWACDLQNSGNIMELVDESLGSEYDKEEAERMVKVAILCTNASSSLRPIMSEVVRMLEGEIDIPTIVPESSSYGEDLRFKAMRELQQERQSRSSGSQTQFSTNVLSDYGSSFQSTSEINLGSKSI